MERNIKHYDQTFAGFLVLVRKISSFLYKILGPKTAFLLAMSPIGRFIVSLLGITQRQRFRFTTKYNFLMETSGYEYYMSGYMFLGETNPLETHVLRALLGSGDTMFDVGAHIGWFALNAAQRVGGKGKVVAFEPNPHCLTALRQNIRLNNLRNIVVENIAVSDKNGSSRFYIGDDMGGSLVASNTQRLTKESVYGMTVNSSTFDSYCQQNDVRRLKLIKIDVEGAEYRVLKGGRNMLMRLKPHLIIEAQEESLRAAGSSRKELFSFLYALEYTPFLFTTHGPQKVSFDEVPMEAINVFLTCDMSMVKRIT